MQKISGMSKLVAALIFGLAWSAFAQAQSAPLPDRHMIDENGFDLISGTRSNATTDLVIGQPGSGGLTFGRHRDSFAASELYFSGAISTVSYTSSKAFIVSMDNSVNDTIERFSKQNSPSNAPYVNLEGTASTLTKSGSTFTYTNSDGLIATYSTLPGRSVDSYFIKTLTIPGGEIRTYNWVSNAQPISRLQSVTNSRGYQIKLLYADVGGVWGGLSGAMGINMAIDYCSPTANSCTGTTQSWPTVSYVIGSDYLFTDAAGAVTAYNSSTGSIRWPGSQTYNEVFSGGYTRNGRTWTYALSSTGSDPTTTVTDPGNRVSIYVFDAVTRTIKSYTNVATSETTTYVNDANGRPITVTLPSNETIHYVYDPRGNAVEIRRTSPSTADLVWTAEFDATCTVATAKICNQPHWTQDPKGGRTDYTYDTTTGGVLTSMLPAVNGVRPTTTNTYSNLQAYYKNSAGTIVASGTNLRLVTASSTCRTLGSCTNGADELRTVISYGANSVANNRLPVSTTIRNGTNTISAVTTRSYDGIGNVTSVDGPLSNDTSFVTYDAGRRVIGQIGPDPDVAGPRLPSAVRTTYNAQGWPGTVENGTVANQGTTLAGFTALQIQTTSFDSDGRSTSSVLVAGGANVAAQQTSYDTLGRVDCTATRMDPATFAGGGAACSNISGSATFGPDRISKYAYDSGDRVTSVTSGFGVDPIVDRSLIYTAGRLTAVLDGKGNKTTYVNDGFGRVSQVQYPDPVNVGSSSGTDYEQFGYDANSQITSVRRRSGTTITLNRDALNRVTSKVIGAGSADDVYLNLDNQGRVIWARKGSTSGAGIDQTYDGLGRLATRTVFGRQMSYLLDAAGRRTKLTYPDGFFVNYGYSNANELTTVSDSSGVTLATYTYSTAGYPTGIARPASAAVTSFTPDALGRLQTLTQDLSGTVYDSTVTLGYNPAGQIVSRSQSNDAAYTWLPPVPNSSTAETVNGRNQLTQVGATAIPSDADTNISTLNSYSYAYNALGQMVSGGGTAVEYDPSGMLSKVGTTDYLYDGPDLIAQYSGATVLRKFVHGGGSDEPLVWYEGSGTTTRKYLQADERGSIITASDNSGVATSSVKYSAYGESGTLASAFGYTGQVYIAALNAYYYKARFYSRETGRFLSPDPIGYADSMNMYGYVGGDPVNLVDPFGFQSCADNVLKVPFAGQQPDCDLDEVQVTGYRCAYCSSWAFSDYLAMFPEAFNMDAIAQAGAMAARNVGLALDGSVGGAVQGQQPTNETLRQQCLWNRYGTFGVWMENLSYASWMGVGQAVFEEEVTEALETKGTQYANRLLYSPNYYAGRRASNLLKGMKVLSKATGVVSAGATGFQVGMEAQCRWLE
ncbi:MAG: RHS repeat-associated core domain-containing protein [Pseudomonadota bacterium]